MLPQSEAGGGVALRIKEQAERLFDLGFHRPAEQSEAELADRIEALPDLPGAILAVHPRTVPAARLATLLNRDGKQGFVVSDMTDLEEFQPIKEVSIPRQPFYLLRDIDRGDDMRNWSPSEALPAIIDQGRTPLTISEGISWLLQQPQKLEPNHCFMTIASRKAKKKGLDARTPAIWISGGTGHDGASRKGAPKIGWCWAGNRHTWLGFASAQRRISPHHRTDGP